MRNLGKTLHFDFPARNRNADDMTCDLLCWTGYGSKVYTLVVGPIYVAFLIIILKGRRKDERLASEFFSLSLNVGLSGNFSMLGSRIYG